MSAASDPAVHHVASLRQRIQTLSHDLYLEREKRIKAERLSAQLHGLLLQERIKHLPPRNERTA